MLHSFRLLAKIMLAMGISIAALGGALTYANLSIMQTLIAEAEKSALDAHLKALSNSIAAETHRAESMSALVASLPLVAAQFEAGDRKALSALFVPGFSQLKKGYGVEQFQFHTPPATSMLRVHMPEKSGDDLSAFRHTVVATNATQKPTRGLEGGVAGLGARGIVPVMHQGHHVGSVEFGMTLGQAFFDQFKARNGVDASLHIPSGDKFDILATTRDGEPLLDHALLKQAFGGTQPALVHREVKGVPHVVYASAVTDFAGKPIGVLEIAMDETIYVASLASARKTAIMAGALALGFGLFLAVMLSRQLARRIRTVAQGLNRVAQGDFSRDIPIDGNDEIGELALALCEMQKNLHGLAEEVGAHATAVNSAAQEIRNAVGNQAATSTQLSASVAQITSTVEELSASSTQIADNSRSVVGTAAETLENSHKGFDGMQTVLDRMDEISADNQENLREIMELGTKSQQISKVMEIINAVADQTRLIAFNAAIEASSAGEAGKRFAVVAGEIRRLADSVTASTGEIEVKISDIQDTIARLVGTSEKGAAGINAGMEASTFTAGRLDQIVVAARKTSTAAEQISLSTQEQRTASSQVLAALREILTATTNTDQAISRLSEVSKDMAGLSGRLAETVSHFKL